MKKILFLVFAAGAIFATWSDPYQEKKYIPDDVAPTGVRIHQSGYYTIGKSTSDWQVKVSSNGVELTGGAVIISTYIAVSSSSYSVASGTSDYSDNTGLFNEHNIDYFATYSQLQSTGASLSAEIIRATNRENNIAVSTGNIQADLDTAEARLVSVGVDTGTIKAALDAEIADTDTNFGNVATDTTTLRTDLNSEISATNTDFNNVGVSTANLQANKLDKTAKAADSELLDGRNYDAFGQLVATQTWTGQNTFSSLFTDAPVRFGNDFALTEESSIDDIGAGQGVSTDGTYLYTVDSKNLFKRDMDGVLISSRTDAHLDGSDADQINSLFLHSDDNLYIGSFKAYASSTTSWIKVFSATDLAYIEEHEVTNNSSNMTTYKETEGCAFHDNAWWIVWNRFPYVTKYSSDTWSHVDEYYIDYWKEGYYSGQQGITWKGEDIYVSVHGNMYPCPAIDRYHWTGSKFVRNGRILTTPENAEQGLCYLASNDRFYLAQRDHPAGKHSVSVAILTEPTANPEIGDLFLAQDTGILYRSIYDGAWSEDFSMGKLRVWDGLTLRDETVLYSTTSFLGKTEKAADSELLDGKNSDVFLSTITADTTYLSKSSATATYLEKTNKAADSNKLDGLDSLDFVKVDGLSVARAYLATSSAIVSGVVKKLFFDAETFDVKSEMDVTTADKGRFTAAVAGYYRVTAQAYWLTPIDQKNYNMDIRRNGSIMVNARTMGSGTAHLYTAINDIIYLTAGQYLEIFVNHNSGEDKTVYNTTQATFFVVERIN